MLTKFYLCTETESGERISTTDFYAREENERGIKTIASRCFNGMKKFNPELANCTAFTIYKQVFGTDGKEYKARILKKDCNKNKWTQ
jgi:hypothetical protein